MTTASLDKYGSETQQNEAGRHEMASQEAHRNPARGRSKKPRLRLRATRSEARRLNRRSFAGVGLGLLVFFALMTAAITFIAGDQMGPGGSFGSGVDLASPEGLVAGLITGANMFGIITLSLWAAATASDYSTGWMRVLVQAEPRRWRLYGGKLAALAAYTLVGMAAAAVVSVAAAPALAGAAGISTTAWSSGVVDTVLSTWANVVLSVLAWGVIGLAVATLTRSATAAIAGGIGYLMVVEGLLGMVFDSGVTTYLPGSSLGAVAAGGTASLAYGNALLLGLAYAVVAILIAGLVFARRDITS